jgi:hypothetical protein
MLALALVHIAGAKEATIEELPIWHVMGQQTIAMGTGYHTQATRFSSCGQNCCPRGNNFVLWT